MAVDTVIEHHLEQTAPEAGDAGVERVAVVLCTAELAECTCPDFCERDHELD